MFHLEMVKGWGEVRPQINSNSGEYCFITMSQQNCAAELWYRGNSWTIDNHWSFLDQWEFKSRPMVELFQDSFCRNKVEVAGCYFSTTGVIIRALLHYTIAKCVSSPFILLGSM